MYNMVHNIVHNVTCLFLLVMVIFCMPYMMLPIFLESSGTALFNKSDARIRTMRRTGGMSADRP